MSKKAIIITVSVFVVIGLGVGIYFLTKKKDTTADEKLNTSNGSYLGAMLDLVK
ncbi:MAG: hypothetical protein RLZZ175_3368 [Bacteroidota bacterium]|jgi:hypothetical protein